MLYGGSIPPVLCGEKDETMKKQLVTLQKGTFNGRPAMWVRFGSSVRILTATDLAEALALLVNSKAKLDRDCHAVAAALADGYTVEELYEATEPVSEGA